VSIHSLLEGGFVSAARFLLKHDSHRSITASLVDVDTDSLNAVLGISAHPHTIGGVVVADSDSSHGQSGGVGSGGSGSGSSGSSVASAIPSVAYIKEVAPAALNSLFSSASAYLKKETPKPAQGSTSNAPAATTSGSTGSGSTAPAQQGESVAVAKAMISDFGKRMSVFGNSSLESFKKSGWMNSIVGGGEGAAGTAESSGSSVDAAAASSASTIGSSGPDNRSPSPAFTIDDDDENVDDGMGPKDTNKISISKTEQEKAQALAMHRLAGFHKGDSVAIARDSLPGAVLFPAVKFKVLPDAEIGPDGQPQQTLVHRFLVVTRERFMVLDSHGGGVGSTATVKSNHHLTEVFI
jgi:hypothetical protein